MKLSEKLKNYRADRPDEWTMDEFIRDAEALEAEDELDIFDVVSGQLIASRIVNKFDGSASSLSRITRAIADELVIAFKLGRKSNEVA